MCQPSSSLPSSRYRAGPVYQSLASLTPYARCHIRVRVRHGSVVIVLLSNLTLFKRRFCIQIFALSISTEAPSPHPESAAEFFRFPSRRRRPSKLFVVHSNAVVAPPSTLSLPLTLPRRVLRVAPVTIPGMSLLRRHSFLPQSQPPPPPSILSLVSAFTLPCVSSPVFPIATTFLAAVCWNPWSQSAAVVPVDVAATSALSPSCHPISSRVVATCCLRVTRKP